MNINILCIGKLDKKSSEQEIINRYLKRTNFTVNIIELEDKSNKGNNNIDELKNNEAKLLLSSYKKGKIIVLDETGKNYSTLELSQKIATWNLSGDSDFNFFIGGAFGHGQILKDKANLTLSFGRITLPHMLARLVLVEQIYRINTIFNNHPYHK